VNQQKSTVSVFGLGYVGCVSAACLAMRGHTVIGVDVSPEKLQLLQQGRSPVVEERIGDIVADVVAAQTLTVTTDSHRAVLRSDISLVCVGTPSGSGGGLSTRYLEQVTDQIGAALAAKDGWHVVVYRSTMVPGTCEERRRASVRVPISVCA
jgi:GDP-mannose 6-dehydrogenase